MSETSGMSDEELQARLDELTEEQEKRRAATVKEEQG